ncbi:Hypothetical protein PHPALM_38040 [Phytophthora palmivora]|uniref:Uncharacterized protein n=1 Tax=Phytophthora palmivora TaxID=4796 RepID=A0A2P4WVW3_9STRA|nr:Hypothetical protein PHPALM_38040 [Phytophthora palmivora]
MHPQRDIFLYTIHTLWLIPPSRVSYHQCSSWMSHQHHNVLRLGRGSNSALVLGKPCTRGDALLASTMDS